MTITAWQPDLFGEAEVAYVAPVLRAVPPQAPPMTPTACELCGRRLTANDSIIRGRGPVCADRPPAGFGVNVLDLLDTHSDQQNTTNNPETLFP